MLCYKLATRDSNQGLPSTKLLKIAFCFPTATIAARFKNNCKINHGYTSWCCLRFTCKMLLWIMYILF